VYVLSFFASLLHAQSVQTIAAFVAQMTIIRRQAVVDLMLPPAPNEPRIEKVMSEEHDRLSAKE
jgi:hypothetical protein